MTKRHRQLLTQRAELDAKRKTLADEGRAIADTAEAEKRMLYPEERTQRDAVLAQLEQLATEAGDVDSEIQAEMALAQHEENLIKQLAPPTSAALVVPNGSRVSVRSINDEFKGMGEFLQAVAFMASPTLASQSNVQMEVLRNKLMGYQAAATGMSVGVPADGGFLVRKDWTNELLNRAREAARIWPLCRHIPISSESDTLEYPFIDEVSRVTGSRWGGVQVYWIAEADALTKSKPKIGRGSITLNELAGLAYATRRLLQDAPALETILTDSFSSEMAFMVDNGVLRGTGTTQMSGVLLSAALVTVAPEAAQAADTINATNVLKMYARIPPRLKPNAVWFIHPDVMTMLPTMLIGQQPVWLPPGGLAGNQNGTLLGRPVIEIEQAEPLGDAGDIILMCPSEYLAVTKGGDGIAYDTSMHVKFETAEMAFRWLYRLNGKPIWTASLVPFKGGQNWSPYVVLGARTGV